MASTSIHTTAQTQSQNRYKALGVRNDASKEEIKTAYRKLASVWHPDRHVDDKNIAITKFAEINNAYRGIMLERHIAAVNKAREEAINPPSTPGETVTRPPALSRPTFSTFGSRRSSSSTTIASMGSMNSSSRSSFESVSTPPSTPRFISRSGSKNADGSSTTYFDRPITTMLSPIRTYTIPQPTQSIDVTLSDLMPTPITPLAVRPEDIQASPISIHQVHGEDLSPQNGCNAPSSVSSSQSPQQTQTHCADACSSSKTAPQVFNPAKPQPPRAIRRGETFPRGLPHLAPLGIGTSKEWKYSLLLTLEELYHGKICRLHLLRYLLDGTKTTVVLDVEIAPGTVPGTKYLFRGVGHERSDRTFQDICFVIQQVVHQRFTRVEDDLVMDVQIPWNDQEGRVCFTGIDGRSSTVLVERQGIGDKKCDSGSTVVFGAGMPNVHGNEVVSRGNLVVRWTIEPAPISRWRSFKNAFRFIKQK